MDPIAELDRFNPDPALREWVLGLVDQTKQDAQTIAAKESAIKAADLKIQSLTIELACYKRIRFANKSEQFSPDQRELFQESWNTDTSAIAAEVEDLADKRSGKKSRSRAGRQPLPDHLPRIEHRHEPESCTCGECGNALVKIGEDVSEQLDVEPARFFVHRQIRPQYACRQCETVKAEPVPPAIIDGGMAAPGLLTWVMISKFADHLPLYRLEQIAARQNVPLSRSTQADWVGRVGFALQPLVDRLTELLLKRAVLHADETPVAQLDPGAGKTKKAYLWSYRSNDLDEGAPIVVFDYQPGRSGSHAGNFLQDWTGHLMVDDYAGYKALFGKGIVELACWAHARRKFFDLHAANQSPIAAEALKRIAKLYAVEQDGKDMSADERQRLRTEWAVPLLKDMHSWLIATRKTVAEGSGTARAIDYSLKRWAALNRYADSGHLPIGRVEMWRGDRRFGLSVSASFVWRCPSSLALIPFPHPARRTGRADFPHPALFRNIKPSRSQGRRRVATSVSVPAFHKGTGRSIGGTPFPVCLVDASTRFSNVAQCNRR